MLAKPQHVQPEYSETLMVSYSASVYQLFPARAVLSGCSTVSGPLKPLLGSHLAVFSQTLMQKGSIPSFRTLNSPCAVSAVRKQLCMSVPQLSRASDVFPFCLASASVLRATALKLCTSPHITGTSHASVSSLNSCTKAQSQAKLPNVSPHPPFVLRHQSVSW